MELIQPLIVSLYPSEAGQNQLFLSKLFTISSVVGTTSSIAFNAHYNRHDYNMIYLILEDNFNLFKKPRRRK